MLGTGTHSVFDEISLAVYEISGDNTGHGCNNAQCVMPLGLQWVARPYNGLEGAGLLNTTQH
jgi:hypothetical protein